MTLLERAVAACAQYERIVVCSPAAIATSALRGSITILNEYPERGMSYSLQLANSIADVTHRIAVLPADLALIEPQHVRSIVEASGSADVTFPLRTDGTPGHPVIFSTRARAGIAALGYGSAISALRDRADLTRSPVPIDQAWPYRDVDYESDLRNL